MKCDDCKGEGKILLLTSHATCKTCKGSGQKSNGAAKMMDAFHSGIVSLDTALSGVGFPPGNIICSPPYGGSSSKVVVACQHTGCNAAASAVADPMSSHPINFCAAHYKVWLDQQPKKNTAWQPYTP